MQDTETKTQEKRNPIQAFWPDVATDKGMQEATKAGGIAMAYIVFSYGLVTFMMVSSGQHFVGAFADQYELIATLALNVVAIAAASLLGWLIWKRQNLIAAGFGLAWIVVEVAMKMMYAPGRGVVIAILALLFSINGVRGTLAAKRKPAAASAEA